jgi:hypothetical protein
MQDWIALIEKHQVQAKLSVENNIIWSPDLKSYRRTRVFLAHVASFVDRL